jgi:N-acetylglucosaminyl-diphospho-decaprenol L-rhamnosyltransferase
MAGVSTPVRVSVVVVSFNTREHLRTCLGRIEPEHEVIVVDNGSSDGSAEMVRTEFPGVRLIANPANRGFGAANNQGMDAASSELILLLNSDCFADPGAIATLAKAFEDPAVVAAGGTLRNPDGSLQESVTRHLTLLAVLGEQTYLEPLLRRVGLGYWQTSVATAWASQSLRFDVPVAQVTGACLMMRPLERFNERFFLYCEDTELCRRLEQHGRIVFVPSAQFTHVLGASSANTRWTSVARYNRGKELYFAIHRGPVDAGICWLLNRLGALLRLLVWSVATVLTLALWGPARRRVVLFARVLFAPVFGPRNDKR